jgi:hypothetical protein
MGIQHQVLDLVVGGGDLGALAWAAGALDESPARLSCPPPEGPLLEALA